MKCPLMVLEGDQSITVVKDRKFETIPFDYLPSKPYILGKTSKDTPGAKMYRDLGTKEPIWLERKEYDSQDAAWNIYKSTKQQLYYNRILDQILLDHPDFFRNPLYCQAEPIRVAILDIEVLSDGSGIFPKPAKAPIISIGVGRITVDDKGIHVQTPRVFMKFSEEKKDEEILREFLLDYEEWDPDIVVGYNVRFFDIPYIMGRLSQYKKGKDWYPKGLSPVVLTRTGKLPLSKDDEKGMQFDLQGRIIMDLMDNVIKDQSLLGIKNKKLKTVLRWYKYAGNEIVELDTRDMRPYVNTPTLAKYQVSDIMGTGDCLFRNYFPQQVAMAEMMGMPLASIINGYSSTIPKISTGRRCIELGLIPMDNNLIRYGTLSKFEAAYVDIFKTGRFETVYKVDFASLYPSLMVTFNLGPDTVRMVTMNLPYNEARFEIQMTRDFLLIEVPDANFKRNMLIEVDLRTDSFMRKDMLTMFSMRKETKDKMKLVKEGAPEWISLNSENWAVKVKMNTIFGFEGLKYAKFGDMATGIAIVAVARWLIKKSVDHIKEKVIEVDTDGIYTDADVDADEMNIFVSRIVANACGQKSTLRFEKEGPWTGYFHRAKNYILRNKNGTTIHGGAFKSSKYPKIFERAVTALSTAILDNEPREKLKEIVLGLRNMDLYSMDDLVMHVRIGKTEYKGEGVFQMTLMAQTEKILQQKVGAGDSIDYYKTIGDEGYKISELVKDKSEIDQEYYLDTVYKAQEIFRLQDIHKSPEQIEQETRQEALYELMRTKRKYKEFLEKFIDGFEDGRLTKMDRKAVQEEYAELEHIQKAISKKWPCPNCRGVGYRVQNNSNIFSLNCLCCGRVGRPIEPPKKKASKRKREALQDGSIRITIGDSTVLLPQSWRKQRVTLLDKYRVMGFLTEQENSMLAQMAKEMSKEKGNAGNDSPHPSQDGLDGDEGGRVHELQPVQDHQVQDE